MEILGTRFQLVNSVESGGLTKQVECSLSSSSSSSSPMCRSRYSKRDEDVLEEICAVESDETIETRRMNEDKNVHVQRDMCNRDDTVHVRRVGHSLELEENTVRKRIHSVQDRCC